MTTRFVDAGFVYHLGPCIFPGPSCTGRTARQRVRAGPVFAQCDPMQGHARFLGALACLRRPLPAFHYMVAVAGGDSVPLVPYFTFGTEALSQAVAAALATRDACLLANHGLVAGGRSLAQAMKVVQEIESLCEVYLKALAVGEPVVLGEAEMAEVIEKFRAYGQARRA